MTLYASNRTGADDYFDLDGNTDVTPHLNIGMGVDTLGRYLFVGFTAKY